MDFVPNENILLSNRQMKLQNKNLKNNIQWVRFGVQSKNIAYWCDRDTERQR